MPDPMQRIIARIVDTLHNTQPVKRNRALDKFFSANEKILIVEDFVFGPLSDTNAICGIATCGIAISGTSS